MQLICYMMSFRATHRHQSENPLQCDFYCFYLQWEQDKTVIFPAENRTMIHDGISAVKDLFCSGILNICLTENKEDNGNHQL